MPTLKYCNIAGETGNDRDLDLYFAGLNHRGNVPNDVAGTLEEDLRNLASLIKQASPDPGRIVIAATGTNPIVGGGAYSDGNWCPANRLQHLLEEMYPASFVGLGSPAAGNVHGCHMGSEYRIILGRNWTSTTTGVEQFAVGGAPDSYLYARLTHATTGFPVALFVVRFSTGDETQVPNRKAQANKLIQSIQPVAGGRAIVAGDFNFTVNDPEVSTFAVAKYTWITNRLICGNQTIFVPDFETVVLAPQPYPTNKMLALVGAVFTDQSGISVPTIGHQVVALRFKVKTCDGNCGTQTIPVAALPTPPAVPHCSPTCPEDKKCKDGQCVPRCVGSRTWCPEKHKCLTQAQCYPVGSPGQ